MSPARVEDVAQGRVWTGLAARERGLVDALGGIDRALEMSRLRAGLPRGEELVVERLPRPRVSLLQSLFESLFSGDDGDAAERAALPEALRTLVAASRFPAGTALAHLPFAITIR